MNSVSLRYSSLVRSIVVRMSSTNCNYEDAIRKLNSLQSNKSTIEQIKKGLKTGQKCTNIEDMENYLRRVGIPMSRLDELSVIHIAGTKGKGSTSAMCESILRRHGFRTGFYSSPHLVAARERIRLDGRPLSEQHFARTLHHVYARLWDTQAFEGDMPKYFAFLTVCAFHEFLQRSVDVAVVEVGIGGIVDYTNVLRKVGVVGITALGLDHTSILGDTLEQVAAAKAGIMKRGCRAYTVRQPPPAHTVLRHYARTVQCSLTVVPEYSQYTFPEGEPRLAADLDAYRTNASLAIQLAHAWMTDTQAKLTLNSPFTCENKEQNGVQPTTDKDTLNSSHSHDNTEQNGMKSTTENNMLNSSHSHDNKEQNIMKPTTVNDMLNSSHSHGNKEQNGMHHTDTSKSNGHARQTNIDLTDHTIRLTSDKLNDSTRIESRGNANKAQNGLANGHCILNSVSCINSKNGEQENITKNSDNRVQNGFSNDSHSHSSKTKITNGVSFETKETTDNKLNDNVENLMNTAKNCKVNRNVLTNKVENEVTHTDTLKNYTSSKILKETAQLHNDKDMTRITPIDKDENCESNGEVLLEVPRATAEGLSGCRWPGRYQVIDAGYAAFYLDGAHTTESMEICAQWFLDNTSCSDRRLVFSATGDRSAAALLRPLAALPLTHAYFVSPAAHPLTLTSHDNYSLVERRELTQRRASHAQMWRQMNDSNVAVLECVADALECIRTDGRRPAVLITGSLHLVGAALSILDPDLSA